MALILAPIRADLSQHERRPARRSGARLPQPAALT
jgi:hypothetical protein